MFHKTKETTLILFIILLFCGNSAQSHPYYVDQFGSGGTTDGRFDGPTFVNVFDDRIYVSDSGNDRV